MPCDRKLKPQQTLQQRAQEVRAAGLRIDKLVAADQVVVTVGPQGAIVFTGLSEAQRDGLTDACIFRRLTTSGSATTRRKLAEAEKRAGRSLDRRVIAQGTHSHDGGASWHPRG